jgi:hypothetical protein
VRAAVLAVVCLLAISACQDEPNGPTAAEAERTLKDHINKLVGVGVGNVRHVEITDPGGRDVPCGDRKAKRTYAVKGDKKDPEKDDLSLTRLDLSNFLYSKLITQVAPYDPAPRSNGSPTLESHNPKTRTNITIKVPSKGDIEIHGATDCLRRS